MSLSWAYCTTCLRFAKAIAHWWKVQFPALEKEGKIRRYRGLSHDVIEDPPAAIENLVLYSQREHPDMGMRTILKWCDQNF